MSSNGQEKNSLTLDAMVRMYALLKVFAKAQTVQRPPDFSVNGEVNYREENAGIELFEHLAYDDGWMLPGFDWPDWTEGRAIAKDSARLKSIDLLTIRKLITALVRNERFCDGALQAAYDCGVIQAILERIGQLHKEQLRG